MAIHWIFKAPSCDRKTMILFLEENLSTAPMPLSTHDSGGLFLFVLVLSAVVEIFWECRELVLFLLGLDAPLAERKETIAPVPHKTQITWLGATIDFASRFPGIVFYVYDYYIMTSWHFGGSTTFSQRRKTKTSSTINQQG
jgi:hypothetical protein